MLEGAIRPQPLPRPELDIRCKSLVSEVIVQHH